MIRHDLDSVRPEWKRNLIRSLQQNPDSDSSPLAILSPDYVTVVDLDRRYVHVSDEFCRLVGYEREELIGK
jgi:PAS domain-containing protein